TPRGCAWSAADWRAGWVAAGARTGSIAPKGGNVTVFSAAGGSVGVAARRAPAAPGAAAGFLDRDATGFWTGAHRIERSVLRPETIPGDLAVAPLEETPDAFGAGALSTVATVPPSGIVTGVVACAAAVSAVEAARGAGAGEAPARLRTAALACAVTSSIFCGLGCPACAFRSRTARSIFLPPLPIQK